MAEAMQVLVTVLRLNDRGLRKGTKVPPAVESLTSAHPPDQRTVRGSIGYALYEDDLLGRLLVSTLVVYAGVLPAVSLGRWAVLLYCPGVFFGVMFSVVALSVLPSLKLLVLLLLLHYSCRCPWPW